MQITCLGHAGLHIETRYGTILRDPCRSPGAAERARVTRRHRAAARFSRAGPAARTGAAGIHAVNRDPLRRGSGARRAAADGAGAAFPGGRPARGLGTGRRRRDCPDSRPERRAAGRPVSAAVIRPVRRAHAAVFGSYLVAMDLRDAASRATFVRRGEKGKRPGQGGPVYQGDRRPARRALGRPGMLPS
jgi:hypothetical protein